MELRDLFLDRYLYRDNNQDLGTKESSFISADSSEEEPVPIPSGGAAQDINTGNVQIDGAQLEPGTYPVTVLDVSNWGWGQTCAFVSANLNTVTWGSGTFTSSSGDTYAISAGTTGVMAAKTYIYLSLLESKTTYKHTTDPSLAVGIGKVLIGVAEDGPVDATYMLSEAVQIVGDNILANTINASSIKTGQLVVGTNVGLGTAQDESGVTTIVGGVVTTDYVNALGISVVAANVSGVLTVGQTAAKCTDPDADQTSANAQNVAWLTDAGAMAYESLVEFAKLGTTVISGGYLKTELINCSTLTVGTVPVTRTAAKCTDADADKTGDNTSYNTNRVDGLAASSVKGWAHGSDTTKIDGGDIYTNTVTATQINVTNLKAISANMGDLIVGGSGNGYGTITIKDSSNNECAKINNNAFITRQWKTFAAEGDTGYFTQFYTGGKNGIIEITNNASGSFGIKDDDSSDYLMKWTNYDCQSWKSILPGTNGGANLGSSSYKWDDVFCATMKGVYGEIYLDQSGRIEFTNHCDPSGAGSYNLGGSTRYWKDVSYKTLTDRGCLGWFDEGVELQDGSKVSDIEAIQAMKKHPTKKTIYGVPMLDYKSFPKVSYIKAKNHDGVEYERDDNDEPKEVEEDKITRKYNKKTNEKEDIVTKETVLPMDGIEMTSVFSIMIGALKELDNRLKIAEDEIDLLKK